MASGLAAISCNMAGLLRGYLGIQCRVVPIPSGLARQFGLSQSYGVEILGVETGSPADEAGLDDGDILVTLGEHPTTSVDDCPQVVNQPSGRHPRRRWFFCEKDDEWKGSLSRRLPDAAGKSA